MSDDVLLNRAAQLIADARVECLKPNFNSFSVSSAASAMQAFDLA